MADHEMRKHALRRYVVFRVKAIEFLDIGALRQGVKNGDFCPRTPVNRIPNDFADSLRTVQLSWFAIFIDKGKGAMDVIKLWKELFPKHIAQIEKAWDRMKPAWDILRRFRNKAGFHADKPVAFFNARRQILVRRQTVIAALNEFQRLFRIFLKAEPQELPDLEEAVDCLLDELEGRDQQHYNRNEFKRYLMIPNTRKSTWTVSNPQVHP
jgi:hypothetical protein